jgi:hypothetical protein
VPGRGSVGDERRLDFEPMEGADWLRTQLTSFGCASCGRPYPSRGIRILAHRDDLYFVDLTCRACGSGAVAIVSIEVDGEQRQLTDPELQAAIEEVAGPASEAVTPDDVLSMHEFLRDFDGDFRALFTGTGREPDASSA